MVVTCTALGANVPWHMWYVLMSIDTLNKPYVLYSMCVVHMVMTSRYCTVYSTNSTYSVISQRGKQVLFVRTVGLQTSEPFMCWIVHNLMHITYFYRVHVKLLYWIFYHVLCLVMLLDTCLSCPVVQVLRDLPTHAAYTLYSE